MCVCVCVYVCVSVCVCACVCAYTHTHQLMTIAVLTKEKNRAEARASDPVDVCVPTNYELSKKYTPAVTTANRHSHKPWRLAHDVLAPRSP